MRVHEEVFTLDNVAFRFPDDEEAVLRGISFTVSRGERVVITGPSGCGKSTLLYLLNRLYPDNCDGEVSGTVTLFGKNAKSYAPGEINHRIATVFQDPDAQFCMPTVEQELAFTLENLRVPVAEMDERIAEVLELTGLTELRHTVIQTLSGGMKQRVATACALVMRPEVLLLDEPVSHLDPYTTRQFIAWLDALQQQLELTIVAVEHRLDLWETFFDRRICLERRGALISDTPFTPVHPLVYPARTASIRSEVAVCTDGLAVEMKDRTLLSDVSFKSRHGEITVIAGPNGSGKSTLIKALCGIYKTSAGTVRSGRVGYVPQSPEYLFLTKSVAEELAFSGISEASELEELMERLRLDEIKDAHPFSVSHGQKRRVAIGAMLADQRHVLMLDEPTSGQDGAALLELFHLLDARAREGATVFVVTHDMEFAAAVADSVLLVKEGKLTGKFRAEYLWRQEDLLEAHHLLPPKGVRTLAESFA